MYDYLHREYTSWQATLVAFWVHKGLRINDKIVDQIQISRFAFVNTIGGLTSSNFFIRCVSQL